jgi:phosphatidylglycerol---prolipoprotein diacylglyceryl transferase
VFPQLFHLGKYAIPTYGVLVATGVLVGLWISVRNSARQGIKPETAWDFGIAVVLAGILGSKILYVVLDWRTYAEHPKEIFSLATLQAGGVFSGGLIAAFIVAWWFVRKYQMPALATCDAFSPGLALGHSIGRLGCFAAGCCYGKETTRWWGVTFTNPIANLNTGIPLGKALAPTQLIESAAELIIFGVLTWMFARKKFDGQVFGAYLFLYGIARFFIEFLRDDPGRGGPYFGVLSGTQLISIGLVLAGGILWYFRPSPKVLVATAER